MVGDRMTRPPPCSTLPSLIGHPVVPLTEKMPDTQNSPDGGEMPLPPRQRLTTRKNSPFYLDWLQQSLDTDEEMSIMPLVSRLLSCIVGAACPMH